MFSKTYLQASVTFLDPSLAGEDLAGVTRFYRPLMDLYEDQLTSCFFHQIGGGVGTMKLGTVYEVLISLHMRASIERYYGKPIREFFPVGRSLKLITVPDRMVGKGTVNGILEIETDGNARLD